MGLLKKTIKKLNDKRYIYHEYQNKQFATEKELTGLLDVVLHSGKSKIDSAIAGGKILICFVVMCARSKVIGDQMELDKQGYEIERDDRGDDIVNRDPLDAERRPDGS
jgi:hypothetical protein